MGSAPEGASGYPYLGPTRAGRAYARTHDAAALPVPRRPRARTARRELTVVEDIEAWCRAACLALPGATVDQPFGSGAEAFRVHGKIFALLTRAPSVSEHPIVNLKAEPREVPLLVEAHDFLRPGWHMNKKHWITAVLSPGVDLELLAELVEDSFDNVVAGLPRALRPALRSLSPGPSTQTPTP